MAWFKCDDPFVKSVRDVYRANVVRAPRAGILPLDVVANKDDQYDVIGDFVPLVAGDAPVQLPPITSAPVASLSGSHTSDIKVGIAAELTGKFLSGLGLPIPSASVEATLFKSAKKVTFEVLDVRERSIDLGALGRSLSGRKIDKDNPAISETFFGPEPADMLIISRVFQSPSFGVHITDGEEAGLKAEVDAFKDLVGAANANVSWQQTGEKSVTFKGRRPLTFAFSAIRCHLQADGKFALGMQVNAKLLGPSQHGGKMLLTIDEPLTYEDALIQLGGDDDDGA